MIAVPALIWAGGNHTTAGYTHNRTYLHSQAGDLRPPLMMSRSLALPGVGSAESLLVFDFASSQKLLVGENDGASAIYTQIDAAAETMDWQMMIPGAPESDLNYVPAYAHGVVVLARIDHRFGNEGDFGRPERFSESFAIDPVQVE